MSQRVVLGSHTRKPVAVVREHGSRVEVIGIAPWFVPLLIGFAASPWVDFDHWAGIAPERSVMEALR